MTVLYNLAKVSTATTGTGTITLGAATTGYLTFAQAGVQNGDVVAYGIRDGVNSEVGTGTYTASGTTLTRNVTKSTNSNNPINLSGSAEVYITARSEDIVNKTGDTMTGSLTLLNTGLKVQDTDASHTLSIIPGTNLTANRTLTWTTGDTSRNITLQGDTTIPAIFPTSTTDNGVPRFSGTAGNFQTSGVAIDNSNNVTGVLSLDIGNADTTISRASAGVIAVEGSNVLMASNIGSTVQGYNANLNSLASVYTAPTTINPAQFNLLEATNNGSNYLTLLAPNSIASNKNVAFQDVAGTVYVSNGTDVAIADGGTGASDAGTARSNLGLGALATASYPGAGIANSTGSAWGSSYSTSGSGNVALTTSATLTTPVINGFSGDTSSITIGTNQFVKDASGNIGIGTTSPTNILSLGGNSARTFWMERHTTANTAGNNLTIQSGGATSGATDKNGGDLLLYSGTSTGTGTSKIQFYTATAGSTGTTDNAPSVKMTLDSTGNVGIGVTPATDIRLDVGSSQNTTARFTGSGNNTSFYYLGSGATIRNSNTTAGNFSFLSFGAGSSYDLAAIYSINTTQTAGSGSASLAFATASASSYAIERMRIDSSGNVGIGTSSPNSKLEVVGDLASIYSRASSTSSLVETGAIASDFFSTPSYIGTILRNYGSAATGTTAGISNASLGLLVFQNVNNGLITTNGGAPIIFGTTSTERMRITSGGNVGIGTSSPDALLTVNTVASFGDGSASTPSIAHKGDLNTGIYFSAADTVDISTAGSQCAQFDSSSNFKFNSGYGSVATAYGCRAWVNFNGTGTVAIRSSGNVSSITDSGVGLYSVNFTNSMPDTNYNVVTATNHNSGTQRVVACTTETYNTGSIAINTSYASGSTSGVLWDASLVNVSIFR